MLALVGRLADGWVPSLGYLKPAELAEAHGRIDDAAGAAGRRPSVIRRVLNVGDGHSPEDLASLVVEHGFDTLVMGEGDLLRVADEVIPKVRELVAAARETH
jgi:hypothetical protein